MLLPSLYVQVNVITRVPTGHGIRIKSRNLENNIPGPGKVKEFVNY